jgi:hypothetical protein
MPLPAVKRFYRLVAPLDPRWRPWRRYARVALGLDARAAASWAREMWSGAAYGREVHRRVARDEVHEIEPLLLPVDWSPADAARARGAGVIFAGAHIGPAGVAAWLVARRYPGTLALLRPHDDHTAPQNLTPIDVCGPAGATSLIAARLELRRGGVVYLPCDGRGTQFAERRVRGIPVQISLGPAALARVAGAVTLPIAALWSGERIRVDLGPPIPPPESDDAWISAWLAWLEPHLFGPAINHRIGSGLLWRSI